MGEWICKVCGSSIQSKLKECPYCNYKKGDKIDSRLELR